MCAVREARIITCLQMGGLRPPQPGFLSPSMRAIKHKLHVIAVFAVVNPTHA